ncbi:hypothetical protein [Phycicoccus sp.]|uniref:hypothetical protein n=1 Tax=Phycicoccus sp. TaxID=1902410 RepID=UPI002CF0EDFA|nr:hypothetical protein [Phycicoccus sp.]HMM95311.1 hypothetical protein [Phycicoccus sp.]
MTRWRARFVFEPRDLWVGLFWDRRPDGFHLYVCLLPVLVIHAVRGPAQPRSDRRKRMLFETLHRVWCIVTFRHRGHVNHDDVGVYWGCEGWCRQRLYGRKWDQ